MIIRWILLFCISSFYVFAQNEQTLREIDDQGAVVVYASSTPEEETSLASEYHHLPTEVITEKAIQRLAQGTLGDTVGWQPGVTSSAYSQGASRPVIRGFDGYRVRVLRDSIGTLDVSDISPDHGLPLDPLLLSKIEILRGPAALLYGNSALGGAVNTTTRTYATELPDRLVSGALESRWDTSSAGWTTAGYADLTLGEFVLSLTGSYRDADDINIVGNARTEEYEEAFQPSFNNPTGDTGATEPFDPFDPFGTVNSVSNTLSPIENPEGTLPNTFHESSSYSIGLSWLPEYYPVEISLAFSQFNSDYGIPFFFSGDPNSPLGNSALDTTQDRLDLRLSYEADLPWLTEATLHAGHGDYFHAERFEGQDMDADINFTGTTFDLEAWEARLDLTHEPFDALRGVAGLHFSSQTLNPTFLASEQIASSRFTNRFESANLGLFVNETITLRAYKINAALRWETQSVSDRSAEAASGFVNEVDDTSVSAVLGGSWEEENLKYFDRLKISLNASYVERIPTVIERFANFDNPAIQRSLNGGGTGLEVETAFGFDFGVEAEVSDLDLHLNLFRYQIDDYIFLQDVVGIGNQAVFTATDAEFYGLEAQIDWAIFEYDESDLTFSLFGDWIRASQRSDDSPLPRIPPFRLGSRLEYNDEALSLGLDVRYAFAQDRFQESSGVVQGEFPTDDYTEINLDGSYSFDFDDDTRLTLFLQFRNLLNAERRLHTSFLKDVAPLAGRNITAGVKWEF